MKIETGPIPNTHGRGNRSRYGDLWDALYATEGRSAVIVRGLQPSEIQQIRMAARAFARRGNDWKLVSRAEGDALTMWIVPRSQPNPVVSRTLQAIR